MTVAAVSAVSHSRAMLLLLDVDESTLGAESAGV
jgi:hypothetical protein